MTTVNKYSGKVQFHVSGSFVRVYIADFESHAIDGKSFKFSSHAFNSTPDDNIHLTLNGKGFVIARTGNGTMKFYTDGRGLCMEIDLSSTKASRDVLEAIGKGLLDRVSFVYVLDESDCDVSGNTTIIRNVTRITSISIDSSED